MHAGCRAGSRPAPLRRGRSPPPAATALAQLPKFEKIKQAQDKQASTAQVSTTDAEASAMKMPDGGFRPAYNARLATAPGQPLPIGPAGLALLSLPLNLGLLVLPVRP